MIRRSFYWIVINLLLVTYGFSQVNELAPYFKLTAGDSKETILDEYKGKLVICFYESRNTENDNTQFKNYLRKYTNSSYIVSILAVADCSSVPWYLKSIWEKALIKRSLHYGYTVYGDWDGKMKTDYYLSEEEANFFIIDKSQKIRYKTSGVITEDKYESILQLLAYIQNE